MTKLYDQKNKRLVYVGQKPTIQFWTDFWRKSPQNLAKVTKYDFLVLPTTRKYLQPDGKILEGGCGDGRFVYLLTKNGYDCTGVDLVQNQHPELKIIRGDVRRLKFKNDFFDGYWSIGVIEHFFQGYKQLILEAKRVLKPKGFFFLTFPQMSLLRKFKTALNKYPLFSGKKPVDFYQFAFDPKDIAEDLKNYGFKLLEIRPFDGFKGLKEELNLSFSPVAPLRFIFSKMSESWAGHCALLVLQKE